MEFEGQPRLSGGCNLLEVPGLSSLDVDSDEGEVVIGIRPKSSPLPRRRSSVTDEDSEPEPPLSGSRRVSFADAKGLSLVHVKEFDAWDVPKLPGYDSGEGEKNEAEEYYISTLNFTRPLPNGELLAKVWDQKVELDTVELLPGTTTLKGVIRVLNISLTKAVYIRTTFDAWSNHFDLLAEYIHGSSDDLMDYFSFKINLVPPFGEQGARVDFCARYETPAGTFWANNNCKNYVLFCRRRIKDVLRMDNVNKKSCLKNVSQNYSEETISAEEASLQENKPAVKLNLEQEVNTIEAKKTTDGQSETSLKGGTKLVGESRRFSSQRSARKAARMARVRDHFARRNSGGSDAERDESPPEAKQAAKQANTEEVPSYSEDSSKSDLFNSLESCCTSHAAVLHGSLQASHNMTHNQPEKAENSTQANLALAGLAATEISVNPLHPNKEGRNVTSSISGAEEETQRGDTRGDVINSTSAEPVDGAISTGINESLCGQNNSITFGTVVAPLYNQMFGKVGSESQRFADWKDPARASKIAPDLTQSHFSPERKESCCNYSTDAENKKVINSQKCSPSPFEEGEKGQRSESLTAEDIVDPSAQTKRSTQKRKTTPEDPIPLSATRESRTPCEELQNKGHAQPDSLPLHSLSGTGENTAVTQNDSRKAFASIMTQFSLRQQNFITSESYQITSITGQNESNADADICENKTKSNTSASPEVDTHLEQLHDFITEEIQNSAAKESTDFSSFTGRKWCDKKSFPSPVTCQEAQNINNSVQDRNKKPEDEKQCPNISEVNERAADLIGNTMLACDSDMVGKMKEKDALIHELRLEMSMQEDLVLADTACIKNWEMMVEEEEETIITDYEKNDSVRCDTDQRVQVENQESDAATEEKDTTQQENKETANGSEKATTAGVKNGSAEIAVVLEYKERVRNKKIRMVFAAAQDVEKEEEYIQAAKTEKAAEVQKQGDEGEEAEMKSEQQEKQIHTEQLDMQDDIVGRSSVLAVEATGLEKEEEIHLNNGDSIAGLKTNQDKDVEKIEDDNLNFINGVNGKEIETAMDLESNCGTTEDALKEIKHFRQRLDSTPNMVEDVFHSQVASMEDSFIDRHGVDEPAHIQLETDLHREADFHSNNSFMSDCSQEQVVSYTVAADSHVLPNELESDQVSYDSESAESDSDDEVELYMHCLRAVHAGSEATKEKATGQSSGKRGSISRKKPLPVPMPSIKESLDEEPQHSCLQDNDENANTTEIQPGEMESSNRPISWWKETFSWGNISKTLLYTTLLFVFVVVAYHYDFLACFGLYLISLVWLCCHRETPPMKKR